MNRFSRNGIGTGLALLLLYVLPSLCLAQADRCCCGSVELPAREGRIDVRGKTWGQMMRDYSVNRQDSATFVRDGSGSVIGLVAQEVRPDCCNLWRGNCRHVPCEIIRPEDIAGVMPGDTVFMEPVSPEPAPEPMPAEGVQHCLPCLNPWSVLMYCPGVTPDSSALLRAEHLPVEVSLAAVQAGETPGVAAPVAAAPVNGNGAAGLPAVAEIPEHMEEGKKKKKKEDPPAAEEEAPVRELRNAGSVPRIR